MSEFKLTESEKKRYIELLSSFNEEELRFLYFEIKKKLRVAYENKTETHFKICDKCNRTYPKLINKCNYCGSELREFEVLLNDDFL